MPLDRPGHLESRRKTLASWSFDVSEANVSRNFEYFRSVQGFSKLETSINGGNSNDSSFDGWLEFEILYSITWKKFLEFSCRETLENLFFFLDFVDFLV